MPVLCFTHTLFTSAAADTPLSDDCLDPNHPDREVIIKVFSSYFFLLSYLIVRHSLFFANCVRLRLAAPVAATLTIHKGATTRRFKSVFANSTVSVAKKNGI